MSNKTTITAEPNSPIFTVERELEAPREKVFEAHTQKELLEKWWHPFGAMNAEIDVRVGGTWKFVTTEESGENYTFYGVFHEVSAPERIIQTEEFLGLGERGHVVLDKYEFIALDGGRTKVKLTCACLSVAERDAMMETGMSEGIVKQFEKLDELL